MSTCENDCDSISKNNLCKGCDDMQCIHEILVSDTSWITFDGIQWSILLGVGEPVLLHRKDIS
jgi:hypothetical protein